MDDPYSRSPDTIKNGAIVVRSWRMDAFELCKAICSIDKAIIGAWVVDALAEVIGRYSTADNPLPNSERQKTMAMQSLAMMGIPSSNEDMYGRVGRVSVTYEFIETFGFPLGDGTVLGVGCLRPCDSARIIPEIEKLISPSGSSAYSR